MTTKTLSINVSGGQYPANYNWSSDCSGITYSNQTGTMSTNGTVTTNITFDETICYQCNFYFTFNNNVACFGIQDTKGKITLSCGSLLAFMTCTNYNANIILDGGSSYNVNSTNDVLIENLLFGTHTIQIELFGLTGLDTCIVAVNGQTQTGNGTLFFTETTSFANPQIVITFQCVNCL